LYRVVKNRALNMARGARRRRERESRAMSERFVAAQQSTSPDRGESLAVIEALEQLEADDRQLIVMRIWGGLKYEEIAEALAVSTSTAHRQYERALTKLKQMLESPCSKSMSPKNER
jgi:RNA polymerase sigma-70 factor (ECF subfamily)